MPCPHFGRFFSIVAALRGNSDRATKPAALSTILVLILVAHVSEASDRKGLWAIDVSSLIGEPVNPDFPEPVWGLAFSPDESQVAIGFGQHWTADSRSGRGHVVVVALNQPKTVLHRFDVDGSPAFPFPENLSWSPSGQRLAVDSRVFSLEGKLVCGLADEFRFAGFLNEDRTVIDNKLGPARGLEVRRSDCTTEKAWDTAGSSELGLTTCPEAGLIAVGRFSPDLRSPGAIEIVTYPGHGRRTRGRGMLTHSWVAWFSRIHAELSALVSFEPILKVTQQPAGTSRPGRPPLIRVV